MTVEDEQQVAAFLEMLTGHLKTVLPERFEVFPQLLVDDADGRLPISGRWNFTARLRPTGGANALYRRPWRRSARWWDIGVRAIGSYVDRLRWRGLSTSPQRRATTSRLSSTPPNSAPRSVSPYVTSGGMVGRCSRNTTPASSSIRKRCVRTLDDIPLTLRFNAPKRIGPFWRNTQSR